MSACRTLPRITWAVAAVALAVSAQAITARTAYATCGDWLDHSANRTVSPFSNTRPEEKPTVPGCHGPQCQGYPLPLSLPQQRLAPPSNDLSAVLAAFSEQFATSASKFSSENCCSSLPGHRQRIERPPRSV
jgi:hypothetical protein